MPKTVVTDYAMDDLELERSIIEPAGCEFVSQKSGKDKAALKALVSEADYVITQFAPIDVEVIGVMKKCKAIVRYGIGVDNVDLAAAAARGIPVCNVPDYCTDEVADHALAMILALTRRIHENAAKIRAGSWGLGVPAGAMHAIKDLTVGLVAFGRIGREVAARLKPFKCKILVHDPVIDAAAIAAEGFTPVSLDRLYAESDLISLHCPSTEKTRYMIDAAAIAKMKPGVIFVNVSRGTLVRTDDLVAALKSGKVAAAGLDVTDPEPPEPNGPLAKMDNVVVTAHIASVSPNAGRKLRTDVAENVVNMLKGGKAKNVVNGVKA
jgi:D-3-phosphoglycerate dehydrogenase / 2-oxoglutarate reductase